MSTYTLTSSEILYGANIARSIGIDSLGLEMRLRGPSQSIFAIAPEALDLSSPVGLAPGAPPTLQDGKGSHVSR